jgi:putative phosphoribosyl transferase
VRRPTVFADRTEAGIRLGECVRQREWTDPVVLGLARGGVPVAARVAEAIGADLDVAVARKIGAPGRPEFGIGAVTADGPALYNEPVLARLGLTPEDMHETCEREQQEARRRTSRYREGREPVPIAGRDVLLVDDGLATGVTARAALRQLRGAGPRRLVFAAPTCAPESRMALLADGVADDVICVITPAGFGGVGEWYRDFSQTTDEEVLRALTERRSS